MSKIKITLKRGHAGKPEKIRRTLLAMGLNKIGKQKVFEDNPIIRGMIAKTSHLVEVESVE